MVSQMNARLALHWRGTDMTLDVFNVFDQQTPTFVDPLYGVGAFRPIEGGSSADLVFLRDSSGNPVVKRGTFELATQFQSPIEVVLGIHRAL